MFSLCQENVFVLIFALVQHAVPYVCSGHWHNYFLLLGWVVLANAQSIFLRCQEAVFLVVCDPSMDEL